MSEKLYVPKSSGKEHVFNDGGEIIKLSFETKTLVEFAQNHSNENGWLTLVVSRRRETGPKGQTHCVYLDTWKPRGSAEPPRNAPPIKEAEPQTWTEPPF